MRQLLPKLADSGGAPAGSEDGDKLDILATLVDRYEQARWPIEVDMDPIGLLHFAIEEMGHTQAELAENRSPSGRHASAVPSAF